MDLKKKLLLCEITWLAKKEMDDFCNFLEVGVGFRENTKNQEASAGTAPFVDCLEIQF